MIFSFCLDDPNYTDDVLNKYKSSLSKPELNKYIRFRNDKRKKAFLIGHGELRNHLALELGINPSQMKFYYSKNGKLFLKDIPKFFSLSHAGNMVFLVVSDVNVGIDCEVMIDRQFDKLAAFIFPEHIARDVIFEKNLDVKKDIFYNKWTEREAAIKYFDDKLFNKNIVFNLKKLFVQRFLFCNNSIKLTVITNERN